MSHRKSILSKLIIPAILGVVIAINGSVSASAFDAKSFFDQVARDGQ